LVGFEDGSKVKMNMRKTRMDTRSARKRSDSGIMESVNFLKLQELALHDSSG